MSKFHIHPVTGTPDKCNAIHNCPFASQEEHYDSREEARAAFESTMIKKLFQSNKKIKNKLANAMVNNLEYAIANTDGDVKNLFINASEKISQAETAEDLNKISVLYAAASRRYLETGETALRHGTLTIRNMINYVKFYSDKEAEHGKELAEREVNEYFETVCKSYTEDYSEGRLNYDSKVNSYYNTSYNNGDVIKDDAHEITIITDIGDEKTVRQILANIPNENVYVGRVSEVSQAQKIVSDNAQELLDNFIDNEGNFEFPDDYVDSEGGYLPKDNDFKLLSGGWENNVYLHKPTMMVYKVPHKQSMIIEGIYDSSDEEKRHRLKTAIILEQKRYAQLNEEKLNEIDAEYCPTYFLNPKDKNGTEIPIVAQPFLDKEVYFEYSILQDTKKKFRDQYNLKDTHSGNLFLNIKTGRIVLIDCLLNAEIEE